MPRDRQGGPRPTFGGLEQRTGTPAIVEFARRCAERGADGTDYDALWRWSVADPAGFWTSVLDFFDVSMDGSPAVVLSGEMPHARWFDGTRVNYVERILRHAMGDGPAVIDVAEAAGGRNAFTDRVISWAELARHVAAFAATLRALGVAPGDRVVGYLPDVAEAIVAFLASASIGAIWSSCGQDYSAAAAADRFGQLEPVVLVAADGYRFGGRERDRRDAVEQLLGKLPTVRAAFLVPRLGSGPVPGCRPWQEALAPEAELVPERLRFDHPLWVLFSSGTTGRPKGIVHGHGGVLLEHLKSLGLHKDVRAGDRFTWYTTPSWMVWNYRVSALLLGATVVCYDGSATAPSPDVLWSLAARHRVTFLGASPGFVAACEAAGVEPAKHHDLGSMRAFGSSGSHLPASAYEWIRGQVGEHVQVQSASGGTDVVTAFADSAPVLPVQPGEMSGPCLGVALEAWDPAGRPVRGRTGELVITRPMPSMPLYFWADADGSRYREAYFSTYPGVWRHGDWITITERGTVKVHGRSDSTLNRHGVRMGSAEIYQAVEALPEIAEALVIGAEQSDGGYWMPLFVRLADGVELTSGLVEKITSAIRDRASPRHVPDDVVAVEAIPHTITGKKLEVPVKRILQGTEIAQAADPGAIDDPAALERFAEYRDERTAHPTHHPRERRKAMTQGPVTTDFRVVSSMLDAIERGDMDTFRGYHAPDFRIWHNHDEVEKDIDAVIASLSHFCDISTNRSYEDRRVTIFGSQAILQHTLTATLRSGRRFRLPAMMRVEVDSEGLVKRVEEYFDSRAVECLAEE